MPLGPSPAEAVVTIVTERPGAPLPRAGLPGTGHVLYGQRTLSARWVGTNPPDRLQPLTTAP
jgi:hypothetical protein